MCWKVTLASRWHPYYSHIKKLKKQTRLSFKRSIYRQAVQFSSLDQNLRAIKITGKPTMSGFSPLLVQNKEYGFAFLWTLYLSLLGWELLPGNSSWNFCSCVGTKEELRCFASPSSPHTFGQCCLMGEQLSWVRTKGLLSVQEGPRLRCCIWALGMCGCELRQNQSHTLPELFVQKIALLFQLKKKKKKAARHLMAPICSHSV